MKKFFDFIKSNLLQIGEIFILLISIILPRFVNFSVIFKDYVDNNPITPDNILYYLAITKGKLWTSMILFFITLIVIRRTNRAMDYIMNKTNLYHDYPYFWYLFCAKFLGIMKCNLILVPIHMQFKLVIRGTFAEYPLNDDKFPPIIDEPDCLVTRSNSKKSKEETNLILEDTYIIHAEQIPEKKRNLFTIKISRNDGINKGRHFSQKFIENTINEIRKPKRIPTLNIFATTNPMNTKHIAEQVFALADRGNVDHLYVFQQNNDEKRSFENKGHKIY